MLRFAFLFVLVASVGAEEYMAWKPCRIVFSFGGSLEGMVLETGSTIQYYNGRTVLSFDRSKIKLVEVLDANEATAVRKEISNRKNGIRRTKNKNVTEVIKTEKPKNPKQKPREKSKYIITWDLYMFDCGKKAQEKNEVNSVQIFKDLYKGQIVKWTGIVHRVRNKKFSSGYYLSLKMKPTESFGSDVIVSVPKNVNVTNWRKGDEITIIGRITRQGGILLDHSLDWLEQ